MKRFALLILLCLLPAGAVQAQYLGSVGLQTTVTTFNFSSAGRVYLSLPNLGQTAHIVSFSVSSSGFTPGTPVGCSIELDASGDANNWWVVAQTRDDISEFSNANINSYSFYANGYFPFLRLKFNANLNSACNSRHYQGQYLGMQSSMPISPTTYTFQTAPAAYAAVGFYSTAVGNSSPYVVTGLACHNPNATEAYVQLLDASSFIGHPINVELGVAANGSIAVQPGSLLVGTATLNIAAVTAPGGSTAVTTPLDCTLFVNMTGPFTPVTVVSPTN